MQQPTSQQANKLKTKDLYQWKTSLTKRGFLRIDDAEPTPNFTEVNVISTPVADIDLYIPKEFAEKILPVLSSHISKPLAHHV